MVALVPFLPFLETAMRRYIPLTLSELAQINDCLRIMELSLLWYGTREHSIAKLSQFVSQEGAAVLDTLMGMLQGTLERDGTSSWPTRTDLWLRGARRVVFQVFGVYPGKVWMEETLLRGVQAACADFLNQTSRCSSPADDELAQLKHRIASLHAAASAIAPAGTPRSSLRFFGCESYGKFMAAARGSSLEDREGAA
jgi:hypothetical protein